MQNKYDDNSFFEYYKNMRESNINANSLIEIPAMKSLLPDLKNKTVLDLGCGMGEMCKYYVEQGASSVYGIDLSQNMIDYALEHNKLPNITYNVMALEHIEKITEKFDVIISSLTFHYIEDYNKLLKDIKNLLNDNGILVFSMEHPLTTAMQLPTDGSVTKYMELNNERYYIYKDYNNPGKRIVNWNNEDVVKHHRNFEITINGLIENGFAINKILEPKASEEAIKLVPKYKFQKDKPYFLLIKATAIK